MDKRDFLRSCLGSACLLGLSSMRYPLMAASALPHQKNEEKITAYHREAKYYRVEGGRIYCELCPHYCILKKGERGLCRNKAVMSDKLYTFSYGNPCTVHVDPIEKKPLYHFLPSTKAFSIATAGCNLSCQNCQNFTISQVGPEKTRNYDLPPEKVIEWAEKKKCDSIAYTYTDPVAFYEYTMATAALASEKGLKNVLVSAAYINREPLIEMAKLSDAANIDLKAFDNATYLKLTGATLKPVLESLEILKDNGVWLEITNLIIPGWTDNMEKIREMCVWLVQNGFENNPLHFTRFTPMYKLKHLPYTPVSTMEKARKIALEAGLKFVYMGNVPGNLAENTYCPSCDKILLERKGFSLLNNDIEKGKCIHCGESIAGKWKKD